jgi:hypothetical protein
MKNDPETIASVAFGTVRIGTPTPLYTRMEVLSTLTKTEDLLESRTNESLYSDDGRPTDDTLHCSATKSDQFIELVCEYIKKYRFIYLFISSMSLISLARNPKDQLHTTTHQSHTTTNDESSTEEHRRKAPVGYRR